MFLDRLAIAGLAWTARTALSLRRTRKPSATTRRPSRELEEDEPLAETQLVYAPDQDLLESLNIEESMGYQGGRR